MTKPQLICLSGPTASGKSNLAMQLAKQCPIEIISVDSAMIYRGMDVGTAKPSVSEQAEVPHHLIDILDPAESYSVAQFCQTVKQLAEEIQTRDHTPLLVGGTMLYFHALEQGIADLPESNPEVRQRIQSQADQIGWTAMHQRLMAVDPESAARLEPTDKQRVGRALEVYEMVGVPLSRLQKNTQPIFKQEALLHLALLPEKRQTLHERIADRFHQMLDMGFEAEVKKLFKRNDLHPDLPSMRCVGYRQMWSYLSGEIDFQTMQEKTIIATRQLAKRQLTWINNWPMTIKTFTQASDALEEITSILDAK